MAEILTTKKPRVKPFKMQFYDVMTVYDYVTTGMANIAEISDYSVKTAAAESGLRIIEKCHEIFEKELEAMLV